MHRVASPRCFSGIIFLLLIVHAPSPAFAGKNKRVQNDQEILKQAQSVEESSGGNAAEEFLLGDSYEHGRGVPQDYAEALRWYLESANRGYAAAQAALAWLYFGHPPSKCSADELQSLDKGISAGKVTPEAVERLSFCTSDDGNSREAYFWVDVALASRQTEKDGGLSRDGRYRAVLLKKMLEGGVLHGPKGDRIVPALLSSEEITAAQARATKWFSKHQQSATEK